MNRPAATADTDPLETRPPVDIPAPVAHRAVEWLVALQSEEADDALREAFRLWRDAHPDHERAWRHIERVNQHLQTLGAPHAAPLAHAALLTPRSRKRRQVLQSLMVLLFAGGGAWATRDTWPVLTADVRTGVGERHTRLLDDGTTLTLNTDSAVNLAFSTEERRLRLIGGEIMVDTGPDPRPLVVETAQGELRPLGTRFTVRTQDDQVRVAVFQGAVSLHPRGGEAARVPAGQQRLFNAFTVFTGSAVDDSAAAWVDGMLIASNLRLEDFLAELARYRNGRLSCDPAVADLRLSGTYPLADTDRILRSLPAMLPVESHFLTRYWVRILPVSDSG